MQVKTGAIIEVGTNSVKLLVACPDPIEQIKTDIYTRKITRLGDGLKKTGVLSCEAMQRTSSAIRDFAETAKTRGAEKIYAAGTYALRTASNSEDFLDMVRSSTGLEIEILSGEEEAEATRAGALLDIDEDPRYATAVLDIGGGSTEIACEDYVKSLPEGSLSISELFHHDPPTEEEIRSASLHVYKTYSSGLSGLEQGKSIKAAGVGGTIVSAASLKKNLGEYLPGEIHKTVLSGEDVRESIEKLSSVSLEQRKLLMPFDPERAGTIIGGLLILEEFFNYFNVISFTVSIKNIIHGIFYEKFIKREVTK